MFLVAITIFGLLYGVGTSMLKGPEHFNFLGYQITDNYTYDNYKYYHIGDCIVIEEVLEYELHHDTPIACYDEKQNLIYIYRIINKKDKNMYIVADNNGGMRPIATSCIIGKVLEK